MPIFDLLPTAAAGLAVAWLVTYAIHSTLALGGLAGGLALWRRRAEHPRLEERLWKIALVGSLATATLQVGMAAATPPAPANPLPAVVSTTGPLPAAAALPAAPASPAASAAAAAATDATLHPPHPWLESARALLPGWQRLLLTAWSLGAAFALGLFVLSWLRLRRALARRRAIANGVARECLDRLVERTGRRRPVRLTGSGRLPVPVALGVVAPEICVPEVALERLDRRQQAAMVAHELAHVVRRDPAWLLALRAAEVGLFFQPLVGVARRRLEALSEELADAWAIEQTGDRVGLARCLTEVAGWLGARRRGVGALPAPGMAAGTGDLRRRIERILHGDAGRRSPRWPVVAGAVFLLVGLTVVPGLTPPSLADAAPPGDEAADGVDAQDAPEASRAPVARFHGAPRSGDEADRDLDADRGDSGRGFAGHFDHDLHFDHDFRFDHDFHFEFDPERAGHLAESMAGLAAELAGQGVAYGEVAAEMAIAATAVDAALAETFAEQHGVWGELAAIHPLPYEIAELGGELSAALAESVGASHEVMAELAEALAEEHAELIGELPPEERERLRAEADRLRARATELAERSRPSEEDLERLHARATELAERSRPSEEDLERLRARATELAERSRPSEEDLERLRARAAELAERSRPSEEDLERLRAEARRLTERIPREEIERLRDEARRLAERSRPSEEDLERLRAEARRLAERSRPSEEELERLRTDARRLAAEARRLAEEHRTEERVRERRERIEERRRELERSREEAEPPRLR